MKKLLILFIFLLLLPLTMAVKPTAVVGDFTSGLILEMPIFEALKVNDTYSFHIHAYNKSNGVPITNGIGCYLVIYNSTGEHIALVNTYTVDADNDYQIDILGANFSMPGIYSVVVSCNSTTQGGFLEREIPVTYSGYQTETAQALQAGLTVLIFVIVAFLIIFVLIKVGNAIPVEDWATLALKLLFYCLGLVMLFIPVAFLNPLIELARTTIPSMPLASGLGAQALGLHNTLFTSLKVALLALAVFGFIYLVYLIYQALLSNAQKNCKGFKGGQE